MAELKTKENDADVATFLRSVTPDRRREEAHQLHDMMARITGCPARMWGASIVGYDRYHYKNLSGREGDWFITGFSPRKQALSIYIMPGFGAHGDLLARLGKHRVGRSCLYLTRLENADPARLEDLIRASVIEMRQKYRTDG